MTVTQRELAGLKPKKNAYYVWDNTRTRGTGRLGLKVYPGGRKTFVYRYYRDGKPVFISIGDFPKVSLSDARERIERFSDMLMQGMDPKSELERQERQKQKEIEEQQAKGSIEELFKSYVAQMKKDGKRTHQSVYRALEKEVYPFIPPETKACDVTTKDLIWALSHMVNRGALTQCNRVRSYLHAAFNHGLNHDYDPANYQKHSKFALLSNPVSLVRIQKSAERVGQRFLSYPELREFMHDIEHEVEGVRASPVMRALLLLCIHTGGQRPYELAASKWEAINWEEKTLLVVADVSKNKRDHLLPLTDTAMDLFRQIKSYSEGNPYIFPHTRDLSKHIRLDSLSQVIARYREDHPHFEHFIPRDLRRTCKTLMGEIGISKELRDRIQNHAMNDVSSKHYDRYDYLSEKRRALEAWEVRLLGVDQDDSNVVPLRG
ncbi:integrase arm-type DNA-binding domain-containing protein [Grimontia kaedaensis]|uniref:Integrase arm-type DNA-binding domain-containing protein n=1 Tax=Grimontia kaedaensis TaxID=2872157 RepID=A0ABY4WRC0_9GAMM|nr:site-specific integrase [Grimontia kaedaensis]USH02126.1 integrase arm-type DNA-binding domain-containing protein [Grimontia kaedaensis]